MYQIAYSAEKTRQTIAYSDAHCHLNLFTNPKKAVEDALANDIELIVTAGGGKADNIAMLSLLSNNVFGVAGIDPEHLEDAQAVEDIKDIVEKSRNIIGIGEIGLDKKVANNEEYYKREITLFEKQLELAEKLDLPVVIHSRNALDDVLALLNNFKLRAMFHFFEGDEKYVEKIKTHNYIISIPPVETSKRNRAIKGMPLSNIVIETDAPIVGKGIIDVIKSASIVSKIKGISMEEVAEATTENLRNFFYI